MKKENLKTNLGIWGSVLLILISVGSLILQGDAGKALFIMSKMSEIDQNLDEIVLTYNELRVDYKEFEQIANDTDEKREKLIEIYTDVEMLIQNVMQIQKLLISGEEDATLRFRQLPVIEVETETQ